MALVGQAGQPTKLEIEQERIGQANVDPALAVGPDAAFLVHPLLQFHLSSRRRPDRWEEDTDRYAWIGHRWPS